MSENLDKFDQRILYELDKDSSISLQDLAKKVGRTKQFVHFRIKNLENKKIIEGYHAIVDMSKLGYFTFRLYFDLQNFIEKDEEEFVAFLKKDIPQVWTITRMHGKWDYAVFIGVKTIKEFHEVWDAIMLHYKEKIKKYNVSDLQVWTITRMHGKWDYAVFIGVKTIKEFHEVWDAIMLHYKEKIKKYNV